MGVVPETMRHVLGTSMKYRLALSAVLMLAMSLHTVASTADDDDAPPAWVEERLAKAEARAASATKWDPVLRPTVLADIYVYDTKQPGCQGDPGNIGSCISSPQGKYQQEVYMCDAAGNLLISRCVDKRCTKCDPPRRDDYGYFLPASDPIEKVGCKSDFLKAKCSTDPVGSIFMGRPVPPKEDL